MNVGDIARLARLALQPEEEHRLAKQLDQILSYVEQLNTVDVSEVEPTAHATPRSNVVRPDQVHDSLTHEDALRNAPAQTQGLFQVPKIVE